jgi:ABC-type lipoprotein release transport system permease subunit
VLFDAPDVPASSIGPHVQTVQWAASSNALNPETISIAALVLGMLLIALVAVGGFRVLAQRRLRSLGMVESFGATDRNVGLVVRANGAAVGVVGALIGAVVGWRRGSSTDRDSSRAPITSSASGRCRGP